MPPKDSCITLYQRLAAQVFGCKTTFAFIHGVKSSSNSLTENESLCVDMCRLSTCQSCSCTRSCFALSLVGWLTVPVSKQFLFCSEHQKLFKVLISILDTLRVLFPTENVS